MSTPTSEQVGMPVTVIADLVPAPTLTPATVIYATTLPGFSITGDDSPYALEFARMISISGDIQTDGCGYAGISCPVLSTSTSGIRLFNSLVTATGTLDFPVLTSLGEIRLDAVNYSSLNFPALATSGDLVFLNASNLLAISFPVLTSASSLSVSGTTLLTSIDLPVATTLPSVNLGHSDALTSVSIPSITSVDFLQISGLFSLTEVHLDSLVTCTSDCSIFNNVVLTTLSLPALTTIAGGASFSSNDSLVTFSAPNWLPTNGSIISFALDALSAASVNHILALCVAAGMTSGVVDLSGGTNAAPTGQGIVDATTLTNAGVSVTTN